MGASFEEKSVWVQLAATVLATSAYAVIAGRMVSEGVMAVPAYAAVFGVSVGAMIVIMVVGFVVAALTGRHEKPDERDRIIAWKAEHHSSWLLAVGVLVALAALVIGTAGVWVAHMLIISLYVSQMFTYLLQIIYYRRGV